MTRERQKPRAGAVWKQDYDFKVEGDLWIEVEGETVAVKDSFDFFAGLQTYYSDTATELERALFGRGVSPEQFARKVAEFFFQHLGVIFSQAVSLHLNDAVHHALRALSLDEIDLRAQAEIHGRQFAEESRKRFGVPLTGVPSPWERRELGRAVRVALRSLTNGRRTLDQVAKKLRESHPDKAPPSGEALRKLLKRHDLSWRDLKSGRFIG